jgi:uncharacterized protein YbaP (TraB family)
MKRLALALTIVVAATAACKDRRDAHPGAPATPAATSTAVVTHPLFWSAQKDGKTSYFLGTMHVGIDAEAQLPPRVWTQLDAAPAFAMEANLDDPAVAEALAPTKTSLRAELGEAYWQKLEAAMGPSGASAVDHLPALVPAAALSMRGLPPTPPMDRTLAARATAHGKPIAYLEPAASQLAALRRWMDVKALKLMLDELPSSERRLRQMVDAYRSGDERALLAISADEQADALAHGYTADEYAREMTDLLYARNAAWITELERLHAAGGAFVAVGALHLVGPRSVLALLAERGYRVTRVE